MVEVLDIQDQEMEQQEPLIQEEAVEVQDIMVLLVVLVVQALLLLGIRYKFQ